MKAVRKDPQPVEQPPPTYDLVGLSEEQAQFLYDLLGNFTYVGEPHPHSEIYSELASALTSKSLWTDPSNRFKFKASGRIEGVYTDEVAIEILNYTDLRS